MCKPSAIAGRACPTAARPQTERLSQLLAIGKYGAVTLPGEVWDGTKYQGRVTFGSSAGWFNLDGPGAPSRSLGWHKFAIERLADETTINF